MGIKMKIKFFAYVFLLISFLVRNSQSISPKPLKPYHLQSLRQSMVISELKEKYKNYGIATASKDPVDGYSEILVKSLVPSYLQDWIQSEHAQNVFNNKSKMFPFQQGEIGINDVCLEHAWKFFGEISKVLKEPASIVNASSWAIQMIDSWGKIAEGILSGHVNAYGDWDECVNVRANLDVIENSKFQGRYCWTYLVPDFDQTEKQSSKEFKKDFTASQLFETILSPTVIPIIPSIGLCIPSTCSMEELQVAAYLLFQGIPGPLNIITPYVAYCNTNETEPLSTGTIAMITVLSVLGFLILCGTLLGMVLCIKDDSSSITKMLLVKITLAFSLVTNIRKWQDTSSNGGFGCVHGIRFFSTCWVLLCHSFVFLTAQPAPWNLVELNHMYEKSWPIYFIFNGYLAVDSFFTMSGLLASLSILKALEKTNGRLNILKLYLHRYLRITPTYALIIGVIATIYPYLADGIMFPVIASSFSQQCKDFWWHNLLYFQNVYTYNATAGESMCEGESWYIANDMQFFIVCPLFIYIIWKWQFVGMALMGAASVASILIPAIKVGTEKLPPTQITEDFTEVYQQPWYRFGPYIVGMWMGYILFKIGKKTVKLPKLVVIGSWMLSTATALSIILGIIPYYYPDNDNNYVASAFYAGLSRFTWGIVICWIIFACINGYGGWVNSFLSWKVFIPLGRLTFCVYLSSASVQMLFHSRIRQPMYVDMYTMTNIFFSHVIMCFLVGFVLTMVFESPFIALEKIILGGGGGDRKAPSNNNDENGVDKVLPSSQDPPMYPIPRVQTLTDEKA